MGIIKIPQAMKLGSGGAQCFQAHRIQQRVDTLRLRLAERHACSSPKRTLIFRIPYCFVVYMQRVLIMQWFVFKVLLILCGLNPTCPYYAVLYMHRVLMFEVLYMQSVLIIQCFVCKVSFFVFCVQSVPI